MSLIQQINQEINQEAKIDKAIDKIFKHALKRVQFKKYRPVSNRLQADLIFLFDRSNLPYFTVILNEDNNEGINEGMNEPGFTMKFVKNTNPRDTKNNTIGDIKALS